MTYSYEITEDFKAIVKDQDGNVINNPGPWEDRAGAEAWASEFVNALNNGSIVWPPIPEE